MFTSTSSESLELGMQLRLRIPQNAGVRLSPGTIPLPRFIVAYNRSCFGRTGPPRDVNTSVVGGFK